MKREFKTFRVFVAVLAVFATATLSPVAPDARAGPPCVTAPAGLAGWWPAEGNAFDQFSGIQATLTGDVTYTTGEVGQGFLFGGIGSAMNVGSDTNLELQNFTIECWIRRSSTSFVTLDPQGNGMLFAYGAGGYGFYLTPGGQLALGCIGYDQDTSAATVADANLHHVAMTKSGSAVIFYLDGAPYTVSAYGTAFSFSTPASIGAVGGSQLNSFYGLIDELSIYSRALTPAEIQSIYNSASGGKCSPPFSFLAQPANTTGYVGSSIILTAEAQGTPPFGYQWSFDSTNISGATNNQLILTNLQFSQAGSYAVTATNSVGSMIASSNAVLAVAPCLPVPGNLLSWWPGDGNTEDLMSGYNGMAAGAVSYAPGEVGQGFLFGDIGAAVEVGFAANLQLQDFTIECWMRRSSSNIVSLDSQGNGALFSYGAGGYGFYLTSGGQLAIGCVGYDQDTSTATVADTSLHHVAVTKSGSAVIFYLDGVACPVAAYGTTFSFSTPASIGAVGGSQANSFYGLIDELSIYSRALTPAEIQSIYDCGHDGKCSPPFSFSAQPANATGFVGSAIVFTAEVEGFPPFGYQWSFDSTNIPGATNNQLILTNLQFSQAGSYAVTATNSVGSMIASSNAVLAVASCLPLPGNPVSWWPGNGNTADLISGYNGTATGTVSYAPGEVGQGFLFGGIGAAVDVGVAANLQLQDFTIECWIQRSSSNLVTLDPQGNGQIFGYGTGGYGFYLTSGGQLTIGCIGYNQSASAAAVTDTGLHHVAVTKSGSAVIFYLDGAPYPVAAYGATFSFSTPASIGAVGGSQLNSFYGLIDELSIYSRSLTPAEIQSIFNCGHDGKCQELAIFSQPMNTTAYVGQSATLTVLAGGIQPLTYQWAFGTNNISGATNSSLILTNVQLSQAGSYSVTVSSPGESITSSNAILTLQIPPPCVSAPANLIAWWRAESDALDELGGINGTATGSVSYAPGEVGQGFLFGGVGAAIDLGYATNLQLQDFTIECWMQRSSSNLVSQDPQGNGMLFAYGAGGYGFYLTSAGNLTIGCIGADQSASAAAVTDTGLHHVAMTKSGGTVIFYLDGAAYPITAYGTAFSFSTPASIGAVGGSQLNSFYGLIDEMAIYNRALTAAEIQSIYGNGVGGKCAVAFPPVIELQPASQNVSMRGTASFLVSAAGTMPLFYQWNFNGTSLPGATNAVLTLTNVQLSQNGSYSVTVFNSVTNIAGANAALNVVYSPASIMVVGANAAANTIVSLPVAIAANGNENSLEFSLNFDPTLLTYSGVTLGSGAAGASFSDNTNLVGSGKLGIAILLPFASTFNEGTQLVADVDFLVAPTTNSGATPVTFGDVPVARQLADVFFNALSATYSDGLVTIAGITNYEGDVFPRPNGDGRLTLSDWLEEGRFVAQLDTPSSPLEFQRADCAPRSSFGDGALTVIDWVQAGRYALGWDPPTPPGGPTAPSGSGLSTTPSAARQVVVGSPTVQMGQVTTANLTISLTAQGNENAVGFTLSFPPSNFSFGSASLSGGASGATLIVNTNQASAGLVAAVLALSPGNSFAAGAQPLLSVELNLVGTNSGISPAAFTSQLVKCEVSDTLANPLPVSFVSGTVTVNPIPSLAISLSGSNVVLSWPLWAGNFLLQSAGGGTPSFGPWSNSPASVTASTSNFVTLPLTGAVQFFRLEHP